MTSRLGEGSTFSFTLPLELDANPHAAPVPVDELRSLRALIVDDNEVNRRVLHEQITSWGMRNGSFADGEEALQALRDAKAAGDPYHFAMLDYQMPGMDGAELARAIKADASSAKPWWCCSLPSATGSGIRQKESGTIDASLVKPVRQSQLLNTLSTAWARKRQLSVRDSTAGRIVPVERDARRPGGSLRRHAGTRAGGRRQYREPEGGDAHARKARRSARTWRRTAGRR